MPQTSLQVSVNTALEDEAHVKGNKFGDSASLTPNMRSRSEGGRQAGRAHLSGSEPNDPFTVFRDILEQLTGKLRLGKSGWFINLC